MAGFINLTFKGGHVTRVYNGYSAEVRVWDPYNKETKTIVLGDYQTESEANAALEGFKKALHYHWSGNRKALFEQ